jgi:hypothetical protein
MLLITLFYRSDSLIGVEIGVTIRAIAATIA